MPVQAEDYSNDDLVGKLILSVCLFPPPYEAIATRKFANKLLPGEEWRDIVIVI